MMQPSVPCRSCGSAKLLPFGGQNDIVFCTACSLVQRFHSPMQYTPGCTILTAGTWINASDLVQEVIRARSLGNESLVIEAGSGDGSLLRYYQDSGIPVLGLEGSREQARLARQRNYILTRDTVLTLSLAEKLRSQDLLCDVLHVRDALTRADDLIDFVRGMRRVLKDDGLAVIETPWIKDALKEKNRELLAPGQQVLFSLTSLHHCLITRGLLIADVDQVTADTTLLRLLVVPALPGVRQGNRVTSLLASEAAWGVNSPSTYGLSERLEAA